MKDYLNQLVFFRVRRFEKKKFTCQYLRNFYQLSITCKQEGSNIPTFYPPPQKKKKVIMFNADVDTKKLETDCR